MLTILLVLAAGAVIGVRAAANAIAAMDDVLPRLVSTEPIDRDATTDTGPPTEDDLANPVECRAEAVGLDLTLSSTTVAEGATTTFPLTVSNTGQVPCLLGVGAGELVLTVHSGDDLVWDSRHCGGSSDRRILLDVDAQDVTTLTWSGTRSASGCPDDAAVAKPGTYRVTATLLTAVPEDSATAAETIATVEETFTVK